MLDDDDDDEEEAPPLEFNRAFFSGLRPPMSLRPRGNGEAFRFIADAPAAPEEPDVSFESLIMFMRRSTSELMPASPSMSSVGMLNMEVRR